MIVENITILMIGVAIGWLASHSTRKARFALARDTHTSESSNSQYSFLSAVFDRTLLNDVYILIDNLYALAKNHRNIHFALTILFFITSSGDSIESGIKNLKEDYPNLFIPSADTVLRTMHNLSPEEVNRMILSAIRAIFDVARLHRNNKDIKSITEDVWLAVDITSIPYYGRMGSQRSKYVYQHGAEFVERSHEYIHNTKDGKTLKYLTVAVASGRMSGLLVYAAPLKVGYSLSTEVDKALSFLSSFMSIEFVLMDRGFYNGEVYEVLRRHDIKFLTPAVKSKGVKQILFEITAPKCISECIRQLTEHINEFIERGFHGRGYKGMRRFKETLRGLNDALQRVNSVAELLAVLQRIRMLSTSTSNTIRVEYEDIAGAANEVIERITNTPRLVVQEFQLGGRTKTSVILSLHFNEDAFREAIKKKFRNTATRMDASVDDTRLDFTRILEEVFLSSYYFFVSPNFKRVDMQELGVSYKRRWTVETAHKMFHEVMLYTTSNDIVIRNLELLVAVAMYDLWVVHRRRKMNEDGDEEEEKKKEKEHTYRTTLRRFKRDFRKKGFVTFQYDEGHVILVYHGEIVDAETYVRSIEDRMRRYGLEKGGSAGTYEVAHSVRPPPIGVAVYLVIADGGMAGVRER